MYVFKELQHEGLGAATFRHASITSEGCVKFSGQTIFELEKIRKVQETKVLYIQCCNKFKKQRFNFVSHIQNYFAGLQQIHRA